VGSWAATVGTVLIIVLASTLPNRVIGQGVVNAWPGTTLSTGRPTIDSSEVKFLVASVHLRRFQLLPAGEDLDNLRAALRIRYDRTGDLADLTKHHHRSEDRRRRPRGPPGPGGHALQPGRRARASVLAHGGPDRAP
jgi:hypothetical protein